MNRFLLLLSMTGAFLSLGGLYVLVGLHIFGADWPYFHVRETDADRRIQVKVAALDDRVSKIEKESPALLNSFRQELASLAGKLATIERKRAVSAGEIAAIHRLLKTTQDKVAEVELRPVPKPVDLAPVDSALDSLRRDLAALAAEAKLVPLKIVPAQRRIDSLRGEIGTVQRDANSLREEMQSLRIEIGALRRRLEELASRPLVQPVDLAPLKTGIAKVNDDMSILSQGQASTGADLDTVRRSLALLRRDLEEVASRPIPAPVDLMPINQAVKDLQGEVNALAARKTASPATSGAAAYVARVKKLEDELFRLQKAISDLRLDFSILRDQQRN